MQNRWLRTDQIREIHSGDDRQLEVIFFDKERIIVEAPAGYGKTTIMVSRHAYLYSIQAISNPKKILGLAAAKQPEYFCPRVAAGDGCACADRGTCLGCGYEIYTKAAFYSVVKEFLRLYLAKKSAKGIDAIRYGVLMEKAVTPAITQMMASMKALYGSDKEMEVIMDILEGGLDAQ